MHTVWEGGGVVGSYLEVLCMPDLANSLCLRMESALFCARLIVTIIGIAIPKIIRTQWRHKGICSKTLANLHASGISLNEAKRQLVQFE